MSRLKLFSGYFFFVYYHQLSCFDQKPAVNLKTKTSLGLILTEGCLSFKTDAIQITKPTRLISNNINITHCIYWRLYYLINLVKLQPCCCEKWCGRVAHMILYELTLQRTVWWCIQKLHNVLPTPSSSRPLHCDGGALFKHVWLRRDGKDAKLFPLWFNSSDFNEYVHIQAFLVDAQNKMCFFSHLSFISLLAGIKLFPVLLRSAAGACALMSGAWERGTGCLDRCYSGFRIQRGHLSYTIVYHCIPSDSQWPLICGSSGV